MTTTDNARLSRRAAIKTGGFLAGAMILPDAVSAATRQKSVPTLMVPPQPAVATVPAQPITSSRVVRPELLREALDALQQHGNRIKLRDRIVIADFAAKSSEERFHFIDLASGKSVSKLVSHGSGSDPSHSGWLKRFSNDFGSNATCQGAFLADNYYIGKHGKSQRLIGLDRTNCNALDRAIVVHGAWYANADVVREHGVLGRSQGCFAVGENELAEVFDRLGQGRMIYAAKV